MFRCFVILIYFVICLPITVLAIEEQENNHKMDDILVTATNKTKALNTPASISIITGKELEAMGAKNVVEAISKIPGVVDSSTKSRSVVIRGNRSAMSGGPVILIDSVPQKMGDYRYNEFNFIPVNQIERIEVLRSAGIAYGPGSARGVINIITKKNKNKGIESDVLASYGSWNTHDENVSVHGMKEQFDYFLTAGNYHTDGYEEEEENRLSFLGKAGYHLSDQNRLGVRLNVIDYDNNTAEGFRKKDWQLEHFRRDIHFPKSSTDSDIIWHNEKEQEDISLAIEFSHEAKNTFFDFSMSWTGYDEKFRRLKDRFDRPSAVYHEDSEQDTYAFTIMGGYHFNLDSLLYTPSFGLNYEKIKNDVKRRYPNDPGKNTDKYNFDLEEQMYGIFWDNDILFKEQFGLKIGFRLDQADVQLEDKVPTKVDEDRSMFSYQIAPSYHFNPKANLYASVSRNYWFPTPRYYAWAVESGEDLNPAHKLEPEDVTTYEIGYKHRASKAFNINTTLYFSNYKDKFGSVYEGSTSRGQGNIGDAEAKGIEFEADGRTCKYFGYRLAAAYQNIEWTSGTASVYIHPTNTREREADISGKQVYWVPEFTGLVGLDFFPMHGLKFSIDMNYTGERYIDYLNQIEYPSKTTLDARVSYNWKNYKFWLLGKNIFDEELEYVSNSSGRLTGANEDPDNAYYVQDGVYVEAGVSLRF